MSTLTLHDPLTGRDRTFGYAVEPNGCWRCTSHAIHSLGYPLTAWRGRSTRAHSIIFELTTGGPPAGGVVRHTCDNRACINPEHLIPGTHADNARDAVERGRSAFGERSGRAKLTDEIVRAVRSSDEPTLVLATRYGVAERVLWSARTGRTWRHLPMPQRAGGAMQPRKAEATRMTPSAPNLDYLAGHIVHRWTEGEFLMVRLDDGDELGFGPEWGPELVAAAMTALEEGRPVLPELVEVSP